MRTAIKILENNLKLQKAISVIRMIEQNLKERVNNFKVTYLGPEHLNACTELDQIALKGLWTKKQWEKELNASQRLCLGIFQSTKLVAIATGWLIVDELHLTAVAVHPLHRRKGLASLILFTILQKAKSKGINHAWLEVSNCNPAGKALYKSCGFITKGRRPNYYKNGSDALIQTCSLED